MQNDHKNDAYAGEFRREMRERGRRYYRRAQIKAALVFAGQVVAGTVVVYTFAVALLLGIV